jgi:single-strand DNA-binding protein
MASYNKVILIGNVTRDPEMQKLPNGTAIAKFGLAMNRKYKLESGESRDEVTFVDVDLFGRTAEVAGQYVKSGDPIMIDGRLKFDQWEDKTSGQKRSRLSVVGEVLQLLGGKRDGGPGATRAPEARKHDADGPLPKSQAPAADVVDDVPF